MWAEYFIPNHPRVPCKNQYWKSSDFLSRFNMRTQVTQFCRSHHYESKCDWLSNLNQNTPIPMQRRNNVQICQFGWFNASFHTNWKGNERFLMMIFVWVVVWFKRKECCVCHVGIVNLLQRIFLQHNLHPLMERNWMILLKNERWHKNRISDIKCHVWSMLKSRCAIFSKQNP